VAGKTRGLASKYTKNAFAAEKPLRGKGSDGKWKELGRGKERE